MEVLYLLSYIGKMAKAMGFEPTISSVTGWRVKPLRYASPKWWAKQGSNL
jgi:hypothetical protein